MNTTCVNPVKLEDITLESILDATMKLTPIKKMRIEVSKKHAKLLLKEFADTLPDRKLLDVNEKHSSLYNGQIGSLYGVPVRIRKYLKKLRIYS